MELASAILAVIESISPVDSEKSDHRQEHPHSDAGGSLYLERVEILYVRPCITAFQENKGKYR